jgi:hypothetical protein
VPDYTTGLVAGRGFSEFHGSDREFQARNRKSVFQNGTQIVARFTENRTQLHLAYQFNYVH